MDKMGDPRESQASSRGSVNDVCVIGAGFAGLAVARALSERNVSFTCIDKGANVGGLWNLRAGNTAASPAYQSLHLNTSRDVTAFSGFPMPDSYPRYPRHDQVAAYLTDFADHYGLSAGVELNTEAVSVRPGRSGEWEVTTRDREGRHRHRVFRHVAVAPGLQWKPKFPQPEISGSGSFSGDIIHSFHYSDPAKYAGKRVLVVGIGNSACDIAVELSRVAEKTVLAFRRGVHVVPKQLLGIPIDEIAVSRWWSFLPFRAQRKLIEVLLRLVRGEITSYGFPEPDHRLFSASITISDEVLSRISHGAITVRPMLEHLDSATAHFADGTSDEVDAVIYCTGYQVSFPFVPADSVFLGSGEVALYQRVVPPHHPGLYFAGLLRPVGSVTRLLEHQAEWIADLVTGETDLPRIEDMVTEIDTHLAGTAQRYGTGPIDSIHVDVPTYLRAIQRERDAGRRRVRARQARKAADDPPREEAVESRSSTTKAG